MSLGPLLEVMLVIPARTAKPLGRGGALEGETQGLGPTAHRQDNARRQTEAGGGAEDQHPLGPGKTRLLLDISDLRRHGTLTPQGVTILGNTALDQRLPHRTSKKQKRDA